MLAGKRLSEKELVSLMNSHLGIQNDFAQLVANDARKGLSASVQRETNILENRFKNILGLDLNDVKTVESVKVMQKTMEGKWILTNLFEQKDTFQLNITK